MGPQMLFWLLGAVLVLPWTKGLVCNKGFLIHSDDRSDFPISWTVSLNETCQPGEGCEDTLIILKSGNRETAVISKGCTRAPAQEEKNIQHRGPPGVTIASFTKICHSNLCNDLNTSLPLWTLESQDAPAPGGLQCPACVALNSCPSNAPLITCPVGTTHCYNGMVQMFGGQLSHRLRVQGCAPYVGCQLLNGTKQIGPISLTESCENERDQRTKGLVCNKGFLIHSDDRSAFPISWTVSLNETCQPGEGCQDTLIILESGNREAAVLSKGCTRAPAQEKKDIQHRGPPGVTIASFTRVCHSNLCNDLSTSLPLWTLESQDVPAPGGLQCPACVALNSCPSNASLITCPVGTTQCYNGMVQLLGGQLSHFLRVQGCAPYVGCQLLNGTKEIGPISLTESCENERDQSTKVLTCYKGTQIFWGQKISEQPKDLTTENIITCMAGELCQETLLFTESGNRNLVISSKGCIGAGSTSSGPTRMGSPGVTIVSYTRVCSFSLCNDIESTASILKPSAPGAPSLGDLQCPTCLTLGSHCSSTYRSPCPVGTSRCYNGRFQLSGGGISSGLAIQGCAPKSDRGCQLLGNTKTFGPIAVTETCQGDEKTEDQKSPNKVSATTVQVWGMGAGLLLALLGGLPQL